MKGYVQVYTGDGKGKTSASLGLSLRAAGAGLRVLIVQFLKKGETSEIRAMERFADQVAVEQYGDGREGLNRIRQAVSGGEYDVVVIDEGNAAARCGLFSAEDLLDVVRRRPKGMELVITGRGADPRILEAADLVTEMTEVKHFSKRGMHAGTGIEK